MQCLRRIADVRRQDKKPNTEVLQICGTTAIEAFLLTAQNATINVTAVLSSLPKLNSRSATSKIANYVINFTTEKVSYEK